MLKGSYMIDLHSHILFGFDDGAKDISESLVMAKQAVEHQITIVAATPHYQGQDWLMIQSRVNELNETINQSGIDLKVIPGAELYIDPQLLTMSKEKIPTYNDNGCYCLLEFPMFDLPHYVDQVLFALQVKGITPIIAHPERYGVVIDDPNIIKKWIENGCLIQMNAGSILGMFGNRVKQTGEILIEHQMVHLIASDAHSSGRRGFNLHSAADYLGKLIGDENAAGLVQKNPDLIIAGEPVPVPEVLAYKPRKRFWLF